MTNTSTNEGGETPPVCDVCGAQPKCVTGDSLLESYVCECLNGEWHWNGKSGKWELNF